jgi:hypothetical protein
MPLEKIRFSSKAARLKVCLTRSCSLVSQTALVRYEPKD